MTEKNKNLIIRLAVGLSLLPGVLYLIYRGDWFSGALFAFAAAVCTWEYLNITLKQLSPVAWLAVAASAGMPLLVVGAPFAAHKFIFGTTMLVFFAAWGYYLLKGPLAEGPLRAAHVLMGFTYGHIGVTSVASLRQMDSGAWWVVAALVITWANDTAAYFAGRLFGKHKLYPEVSPNKTWEGFAGGFVGSIGGMFILRTFFWSELSAVDCLVLGAAGAVLGPAGDLCESMLKRAYGVKDSGRIIPGHGGMLDRIDALIFNAPMVLMYAQFVRPML